MRTDRPLFTTSPLCGDFVASDNSCVTGLRCRECRRTDNSGLLSCFKAIVIFSVGTWCEFLGDSVQQVDQITTQRIFVSSINSARSVRTQHESPACFFMGRAYDALT